MDTCSILSALGIDTKFPELYGIHYKCVFSLFWCNLKSNKVQQLFEFSVSSENAPVIVSIPNGTVEEIFQHDITFNNEIARWLLRYIKGRMGTLIMSYPDDLLYVVFCILHEIGHWRYLDETNMGVREYYHSDSLARENLQEMAATLRSMPESKEKEELADKYYYRYREIESEKNADQYAFDNLLEALNCLAGVDK